jgi:hypothetical protein
MTILDESDGSDESDIKSDSLAYMEKKGKYHRMDKTDKRISGDCEEGIEAAIPLMKDRDGAWVVHASQTRRIAGQFHDLAVMCMTLMSILLCVVFYMICPKCLFGVLLLSACLCPFVHAMNVPLWLAIILLIVSGWSFSAGALSITWNNGL